MRKYALVVGILAALPCAEAKADVGSSVTISGITVKPQGDGWNITMTGTTTLGTGCTLTSYLFSFTDPNGNKLAGLIAWTQPMAGQTTNFTVTLYTTTQGSWTGTVNMNYNTPGGGTGSAVASQPFTVPAK
jgi:hypothetical protein